MNNKWIFFAIFQVLLRPFLIAAFEPPVPAPVTPAPTPTPVVRFTPLQPCTCQAFLRECDPPSRCLCQFSGTDGCACARSDSTSGVALVCGTFECCEGQRRRELLGAAEQSDHDRRLMGADFAVDLDDPVHQELYKSYLQECGDHEYDIWLYVTSHLYAVASPKEPQGDEDKICPFLVTHARFEDPTNKEASAAKKLLFWESKEEGEARFAKRKDKANKVNWRDKSYLVGQFTLNELATAYKKVDPADKGPYDVVTNNCAHYIIQLAQELGVKVDGQVTSFVVRRLTEESSAQMMDLLHKRMARAQSLWTNFYHDYVLFYCDLVISWLRPGGAVDASTTIVIAHNDDGARDSALLETLVSEQAGVLLV